MTYQSTDVVNGGQLVTMSGKQNITSNTLVASGSGFVFGFSVVSGGTAAGAIYDANATSNASAANAIASCPTIAGGYVVSAATENGIVVEPGSGQAIAISYG